MGSDGNNESCVERVFSSIDKAVDYVKKEHFVNNDFYRTASADAIREEVLRYWVYEEELDRP